MAKDVRALASTARQHGYRAERLEAVEAVNERQKEHLFELIVRHYVAADALRGLTFALWGLAFKTNTDDMREASSRRLLQRLRDDGARVQAFDPEAVDRTRRIFGERNDLVHCEDMLSAARDANALVVVTERNSFRFADFKQLGSALRDRVVFDGRNLYDPAALAAAGLNYFGVAAA